MAFTWPAPFPISDKPVHAMVGRSSQTVDGYFRTNKRPIRDGDELVVGPPIYTVAGSPHEHRFLLLAEIDPNVEAVAPHPIQVSFELGGKKATHIVHYAVMVAGQPEFIDCRSHRAWSDAALRMRLTAVARHVESTPWRFHLALDSEMRSDPRSEPAEDLWRRHRPTFTRLQELAATGILADSPEMPIADLMSTLEQRMGAQAPTFEQVLSLAANNRIFIDLWRPIGRGSHVRYADRRALPRRLIPCWRPRDGLPEEARL